MERMMEIEEAHSDNFSDLFYELKFYGFFVSDVTDILQECFIDDVEGFFSKVSKAFSSGEEKNVANFETLIEDIKKSVKKHTPSLNALMKRFLGIKHNVLFPDDEIHNNIVSKNEEDMLKERLETLRRQHSALSRMLKRCETVINEHNINQSALRK